jgi:hypothetical protein
MQLHGKGHGGNKAFVRTRRSEIFKMSFSSALVEILHQKLPSFQQNTQTDARWSTTIQKQHARTTARLPKLPKSI